MKIVFPDFRKQSGHTVRGVGRYTAELVKALQKISPQDKFVFSPQPLKTAADLVHFPFFNLFSPSLPLFPCRKIVVTVHDVIPLLFPRSYPPGLLGQLSFYRQRYALSKVQAVLTDSQSSRRDIINFLKVPSEKIFVTYLAHGQNCYPREDFASLEKTRLRYHLPKEFVLYVGDVNFNKNLINLAQAVKLTQLPLVIVGQNAAVPPADPQNPQAKPFANFLAKFSQDPQIIRLGFVPEKDLPLIYNLASVYAQPSFYEGFGLPPLEAMACGIPVVVAKNSSLKEIYRDCAVVVDPHRPTDIARGINLAVGDPALRKELVQKGLTKSREFSWEKTARQTFSVYEKILSR